MPLPQHAKAELMVLSALISDWPWAYPLVKAKSITETSFYAWRNRLVFRTLKHLRDPGPYTLFQQLHPKHSAEWQNLPRWIADVHDMDPTGCSCEYWATQVRQYEVRRGVILKANEMIQEALRGIHAPTVYEQMLGTI